MKNKQTKIKPNKTVVKKKKPSVKTSQKQTQPISWWQKSKINLWWQTFKKYFKI